MNHEQNKKRKYEVNIKKNNYIHKVRINLDEIVVGNKTLTEIITEMNEILENIRKCL